MDSKRRPSRGSRRSVAVALAFTPSDLGCSFVLGRDPGKANER
jgi:hypothetical protein